MPMCLHIFRFRNQENGTKNLLNSPAGPDHFKSNLKEWVMLTLCWLYIRRLLCNYSTNWHLLSF